MCLLHRVAALFLSVILAASPAMAGQGRLVTPAALQQAIADQASAESTQRAALTRVLDRDDVRQMAARLGLQLTQATTAVATLGGADLAAAASQAQSLETALAGGANTVVISVTTLLLLAIIVILLAS